MNIAEAMCLYRYSRLCMDKVIVEIGRRHGGSTKVIASALRNGMVHSVDKTLRPEVNSNLNGVLDKVHIITGDSKEVPWSMPIDMLFVDGDHSYKGVQADVDKYVPHVMPMGFIIFHDAVGMKPELDPVWQSPSLRECDIIEKVNSMAVWEKRK